ncbi:MAG: SDR family oxidoreductase [Sphingomonas sp.]|nr:SDR family oxidoreductase [Sphingomonas sp.]
MTGRVAIITGAGSGIGRAAALAFGERGYRLVLAGRRVGALDETIDLLGPAAARAIACGTDVADATSVQALFDRAVRQFGRIDLLFNNAGISAQNASIDAVDEGDWRRVIDINLTGAFLCLRAAFRAMKDQAPPGGRIINNGSIAATSPRPNSIAYAASKHAITGLTRSASLEGRVHDIACGQIDIGNAASNMAELMMQGTLQADGTTKAEPTIDLAHVAQALVYMDSLPLEANVQFLTIMATKMPFVGRG